MALASDTLDLEVRIVPRAARYAVCALAAAALGACRGDRGDLEVTLSGTPIVTPLAFHGNCVAGWTLGFVLRVAETRGRDVVVTSLSFQVDDVRTGQTLGHVTADREELRQFTPAVETVVPAGGSTTLAVGVRVSGPLDDPVRIRGALSGDDGAGHLTGLFDFGSQQTTVAPLPIGAGGACPPSS